jgi:hypothetical protein
MAMDFDPLASLINHAVRPSHAQGQDQAAEQAQSVKLAGSTGDFGIISTMDGDGTIAFQFPPEKGVVR